MKWPLFRAPPLSVRPSRQIGAPREGTRLHAGVDVDADLGELVQAPFDGWMEIQGWETRKGLLFRGSTGPTIVVGPVRALPGYALRSRPVRAGEIVAVVERYLGADDGENMLHVEAWPERVTARQRLAAVNAAAARGTIPPVVDPLSLKWDSPMNDSPTPPPPPTTGFSPLALLLAAAAILGLLALLGAVVMRRTDAPTGPYGVGRLDDLDLAELRSLYRAIKGAPPRREWGPQALMTRIDAAAAESAEAKARGDAWWREST